jgi:hypothetical protein
MKSVVDGNGGWGRIIMAIFVRGRVEAEDGVPREKLVEAVLGPATALATKSGEPRRHRVMRSDKR